VVQLGHSEISEIYTGWFECKTLISPITDTSYNAVEQSHQFLDKLVVNSFIGLFSCIQCTAGFDRFNDDCMQAWLTYKRGQEPASTLQHLLMPEFCFHIHEPDMAPRHVVLWKCKGAQQVWCDQQFAIGVCSLTRSVKANHKKRTCTLTTHLTYPADSRTWHLQPYMVYYVLAKNEPQSRTYVS
jgi:hypothetical protein